MAGTATLTNTIRWPGPNGKLLETHYVQFDAGTVTTIAKTKIGTLEAAWFAEVGGALGTVAVVPTVNMTVQGGTTLGNYSISVPTTGVVLNTIGTTVSNYFVTLMGY